MSDRDREEGIRDLSRGRSQADRAARADELVEEREQRARDLAFEQGKREAIVDSRLTSHELRLAAINGSIEKHANNAAELRQSIDVLSRKVDSVFADQAKREAVSDALRKEVQKANDRQISTRAFALGIASVVVALLGVMVTVLVGVHAI